MLIRRQPLATPGEHVLQHELSNALIIKLRHHGDVLLSAPVFTALKSYAPECEIDALVYSDTAAMLTGHPAISEVHTIDRSWKRLGIAAQAHHEWRLLSRLRARRYDLVVHLSPHPRGAWLSRVLGPRFAVTPKVLGKGAFWTGSFSHFYPKPAHTWRHTVEHHLDALRRIGIQPAANDKRVTLVPGAAAEQCAQDLLIRHGLAEKGFILLHPASRWLFKCWPAQQTAALLSVLHDEGHSLVLTSAPDAQERALIAAIRAQTRAPVTDLSGSLTLKELAAIISRARLFIGVDSAPMHIAAAMGTPTVAIFGPSGDPEWGPWNVASRIVASDVHPCRPCGLDGCGGGKISECLTTLPVDRVLSAVHELLAASDHAAP